MNYTTLSLVNQQTFLLLELLTLKMLIANTNYKNLLYILNAQILKVSNVYEYFSNFMYFNLTISSFSCSC